MVDHNRSGSILKAGYSIPVPFNVAAPGNHSDEGNMPPALRMEKTVMALQ